MAVIFQKNIRNTFLYMTWYGGLIEYNPVVINGSPQAASLTFYGGVQPSAANIAASWASYNTSYLLHLGSGGLLGQPNSNTVDTGVVMTFTTLPTAQTSFAAGTTTWAILWPGDVTPVTVQGATIPDTKFIVLPVSDAGGSAPVRLASTTIASATSYTISDFQLTAAGGIS